MARVFIYVVDRDFGFAPNPFHGLCTLATCKPGIRDSACVGDWVIGMGGRRLKASGRCVFAMKVDRKITFNEYWHDPTYRDKRPVRNGSLRMLVGDNIYQSDQGIWSQANSHHSNPDGSENVANRLKDTSVDAVLIAEHFYYFGRASVLVPVSILQSLNYVNQRNYRVYDISMAKPLVDWIAAQAPASRVIDDPVDFSLAEARYSDATNKITRSK
jgi:hypothetical protein